MKNYDEDEEFVNEEDETFILNDKEYSHSKRWKEIVEHLHKLGPHEQDKMRAEIRAEANRELERLTAKEN